MQSLAPQDSSASCAPALFPARPRGLLLIRSVQIPYCMTKLNESSTAFPVFHFLLNSARWLSFNYLTLLRISLVI